jgi:hypothetical protein
MTVVLYQNARSEHDIVFDYDSVFGGDVATPCDGGSISDRDYWVQAGSVVFCIRLVSVKPYIFMDRYEVAKLDEPRVPKITRVVK